MLILLVVSPTHVQAIDRFALEAGAVLSAHYSETEQVSYAGLGLAVRAFYNWPRWSLGIGTRGMLTTKSNIQLIADSFTFAADLTRRHAALGPVARYYFPDGPGQGRTYAELGILSVQYDMIRAERILDFSIEPGEERLLVRGYGISLSGGFQFKNSPIFIQFSYELEKYDWIQIVGLRKLLNYTISEPSIRDGLLVHAIFVTIGLSNVLPGDDS